jgi:hypothetical protein
MRNWFKLFLNGSSVLTPAQVRAAREEIHVMLDFWGKRLGIRNGLKAYVVEPALTEADSGHLFRQFQFVGFLLGEPPDDLAPDPDLRDFLRENEEQKSRFENVKHLAEGHLRRVLTRAFAWPAVMLFQPEQWPSFDANSKGWPVFRAFGQWRQLLAEPTKPDPFERLPPALDALARHNRRRAAAARADYVPLLQAARQLWPKVLDIQSTGRRGRPAHKQRLAALLAGEGITVSRRQLDRLMADLKG